MSKSQTVGQAGASAGMAAAICLAASNLIFVAFGFSMAEALQWSAWLAGITLGLTWAGVYFGTKIGNRSADYVSDRVAAATTK